MKIKLKKQPQKYLAKVDEATRRKLKSGIEEIREFRGDIKRLRGMENMYRYKIEHYRILFQYSGEEIIIVDTINTRTNIKY